jgi:uncharacterized protein YqgC (DUF456 family)
VTVLIFVLGVLLIAAGLAGLLVPGVPGTPLIFAGSLLIAWANGFARVGWISLTMIGLLGAAGVVLDQAASLFGARTAGASKWGVLGAVAGLLLGLPLGLPGIVLGPAVGATVFEYYKNPDLRRAATAGAGVFVGFLVGTALKYACAAAMVGVLLAAFLF